jgi:hypothetical protein
MLPRVVMVISYDPEDLTKIAASINPSSPVELSPGVWLNSVEPQPPASIVFDCSVEDSVFISHTPEKWSEEMENLRRMMKNTEFASALATVGVSASVNFRLPSGKPVGQISLDHTPR